MRRFKIKLSKSAQGAFITMDVLDTSEKKHAQVILDGNRRLTVQILASN